VTIVLDIPGRARAELEYLLLDVNGTLTDRGTLLDGVRERLAALGHHLDARLLSADTYASLEGIAEQLGIPATRVAGGQEKLALLRKLGPSGCVCVGNGVNDVGMLREATLGIAVLGPEGASAAAVAAADIVCRSVIEALDLLLEPRAIEATLRG
jgi:P-type E1-E2 ATPase